MRANEKCAHTNVCDVLDCAVSGSPVDPGNPTRYRMRLPHVDGSGKVSGFMYFCCWPCVCDSRDFIRVDTATIVTKDKGPARFKVAVIGNPCERPKALAEPWKVRLEHALRYIAHWYIRIGISRCIYSPISI
eukprot:SAG11_NODE_47_length_20431_cov_7.472752_1_plen_132_part_00